MHLNPSRNQIFAKCRNTIKEAMFRILNFKICKDFDQSSNINLVALYFPLQLLGSQKFARSDKIMEENRPMKMVQRCCARVSRVSSQSRCRAQFLAATWPTDTAESFSSRAPAYCVSSHRILLQPEPEPLSPCLETTRAAGKAIGRRLCADPSSRRLPTLELDAVASLFKARCTDPSPHRCLKHALVLPLPPFWTTRRALECTPSPQPARTAPLRLSPSSVSPEPARAHTSSSPHIKLRQLFSVPFEQEANPQAVDAFVANECPFDNFVPHSEPFPTPSATSSPAHP